MSDKDFLSQFSGSNKKPDSFKEEESNKTINPYHCIFNATECMWNKF